MDEGVLIRISDDFGPPIYRRSPQFAQWYEKEAPAQFPLFQKFKELNKNRDWLIEALSTVNKVANELKINAKDFQRASEEIEWEPIPVQKSDPRLREVEENLEAAIDGIEADNGYAVNAPGEREYVLTSLKEFRDLLKTKTEIYWPQVKTYAIDPLTRVIRRFGDATVGILATAARQSLIEWLKIHLPKAIGWLFS